MAESKRFLGEEDATFDDNFRQHFVESSDLDRLVNPNSDIIFGCKGAGKTALRRALCELKNAEYFTTITIDLDRLLFPQIHTQLSLLREASGADVPKLASITWRNILSVYCLEAVAETLHSAHSLRREIEEYLHESGFILESSSVDALRNNQFLIQIERLFLLAGGVGIDQSLPKPILNAQQKYGQIDRFPENNVIERLLLKAVEVVRASDKPALVCLDGLDSIVPDSRAPRQEIFAGLIDAIFRCSKDPILHRSFCFKAFIPQEMTYDIYQIWDADKFGRHTHYMGWEEEELKNFLLKRLVPHSRTKSPRFDVVWNEFMPEKVVNDIHKTDENTFKYILRHTLYRPRQLLIHVQRILDEWDRKNQGFRVDPSFIPGVVATTNVTLTKWLVAQVEQQHPD